MMPAPNMRSMIAQGGRWVVSRRRNFSSSPVSTVESKGERLFADLNPKLQLLIGVISMSGGYGVGNLVMGTLFYVPLEEKFARVEKLRLIVKSQSS